MGPGSPFQALHEALASAVHQDLPSIRYWQRDWPAFQKLAAEERKKLGAADGPGDWAERRPSAAETLVTMFPQMWNSTACGYGGIGGAAMTTAYTIVVSFRGVSCVYFGCGRLAYALDEQIQSAKGGEQFRQDMSLGHLASCADAHRYM